MVCRAAACGSFPSLSVVAGMPAEPNQLKYDQGVFGFSSTQNLVEASLFPLLKYGNNRQNKDVPTRPRSIHKGAVGMMYTHPFQMFIRMSHNLNCTGSHHFKLHQSIGAVSCLRESAAILYA